MNQNKLITGILAILPLAIFWGFNHQNLPLKFSLILGMMTFPYVLIFEKEKGNFKYAFIALLLSCLLLLTRSSSLYFFSSFFILLFVLDRFVGKLNKLPVFLCIAISPILSNVVYIWSFPIRLKLTDLAVKSLQLFQFDISANGNMLVMNGNSFSVDPACIGLKTVITSLVLGIVIMAYFERKSGSAFSTFSTLILLPLILVGAVLSNFVRLLLLVIYVIMPGNPLHDLVGLLCMFIYVLIPFYFILKFAIKQRKIEAVEDQKTKLDLISDIPKDLLTKLCLVVLFSLQIYNGIQFLHPDSENKKLVAQIEIDGFEETVTENGMLKLENENALIYVKPPVKFYQGSHDPRFCWQGSGYTFSNVKIDTIANKILYTANLSKDADELYSAWWYENSQGSTPHEWDWRWKTAQGNGLYYMININCTSKESLLKSIDNFNKDGRRALGM